MHTYTMKYKMPSLTSSFVYRLGCHFLVTLYKSKDCFDVCMTARINSAAARTKLGVMYDPSGDGRLYESVQTDMSRTWKTITAERDKKQSVKDGMILATQPETYRRSRDQGCYICQQT